MLGPLNKITFRNLIVIIGILVALVIGLGYSGLLSHSSSAAYQLFEPIQSSASQLETKSLVQSLAKFDF